VGHVFKTCGKGFEMTEEGGGLRVGARNDGRVMYAGVMRAAKCRPYKIGVSSFLKL